MNVSFVFVKYWHSGVLWLFLCQHATWLVHLAVRVARLSNGRELAGVKPPPKSRVYPLPEPMT